MKTPQYDSYPIRPNLDSPVVAPLKETLPIDEGDLDESKAPMSTDADHDFSTGYSQPPAPEEVTKPAAPTAPDIGKVAATRYLSPDDAANQKILADSARATPARVTERTVSNPEIPSTYEITKFAIESDAVYASNTFCASVIELLRQQEVDGIDMNELSASQDKLKMRLMPRGLAPALPDGSAAEKLEIYLTPDMYDLYRTHGLIPEATGGEKGIPRLYWVTRDGDGTYRAGTNATCIYLPKDTQPLRMATPIGTYKGIERELKRLPGVKSVAKQYTEEQEAAERKRRESHPYNYGYNSRYTY